MSKQFSGRLVRGSTTMNRGFTRTAFTLIELLVVISIIVLLAAILLETL